MPASYAGLLHILRIKPNPAHHHSFLSLARHEFMYKKLSSLQFGAHSPRIDYLRTGSPHRFLSRDQATYDCCKPKHGAIGPARDVLGMETTSRVQAAVMAAKLTINSVSASGTAQMQFNNPPANRGRASSWLPPGHPCLCLQALTISVPSPALYVLLG